MCIHMCLHIYPVIPKLVFLRVDSYLKSDSYFKSHILKTCQSIGIWFSMYEIEWLTMKHLALSSWCPPHACTKGYSRTMGTWPGLDLCQVHTCRRWLYPVAWVCDGANASATRYHQSLHSIGVVWLVAKLCVYDSFPTAMGLPQPATSISDIWCMPESATSIQHKWCKSIWLKSHIVAAQLLYEWMEPWRYAQTVGHATSMKRSCN